MAAADPSHAGRYAVATSAAGNTELQVYLTDDYGKTWKARCMRAVRRELPSPNRTWLTHRAASWR